MSTIIRMWSGPRNLSTALMRSWGNRADTAVMDEPLYAHYLQRTGLDHPAAQETIAAGPTDLHAAIDGCQRPALGPDQTISYQKHMAHHLLPAMDLGWIGDATNILLVRHPRRVIASYARVREQPTLEDLAFPQLLDLQERFGPLPVVEADTFLSDPERSLRAICAHAGVVFDPEMLSWPAGSRATDGAWASHWYGSVDSSTGFGPAPSDHPETVPLPESLEPIAEQALHLFRLLTDEPLPSNS